MFGFGVLSSGLALEGLRTILETCLCLWEPGQVNQTVVLAGLRPGSGGLDGGGAAPACPLMWTPLLGGTNQCGGQAAQSFLHRGQVLHLPPLPFNFSPNRESDRTSPSVVGCLEVNIVVAAVMDKHLFPSLNAVKQMRSCSQAINLS